MKIDHIKSLLIATATGLFISLFHSCSDINEIQQPFLDQAGRIYVGKIDSLQINGGTGRVEIVGSARYARTARTCRVSWGDSSQREFAMSEILDGDSVRILLNDIPEGNYMFSVQTFDEAGNKSIKESGHGISYGEEYRLSCTPKMVVKLETNPSTVLLHWSLIDHAVRMKVEYDAQDGTVKEVAVSPDDILTEIPLSDCKLGGRIISTTYILPEAHALDTIILEPMVQYFPESAEFPVDKTLFRIMNLPTDNTGCTYVHWAGPFPPEYLIDDNTATKFHTGDTFDVPTSNGVPCHVTIDLGVRARLSKYRVFAELADWTPSRIQLWGIDELTPENYTTLSSMDPGWEDEARAKGWTLLSDNRAGGDFTDNTYTIPDDNKITTRYIRIRFMASRSGDTGPNTFVLANELYFWANVIESLE